MEKILEFGYRMVYAIQDNWRTDEAERDAAWDTKQKAWAKACGVMTDNHQTFWVAGTWYTFSDLKVWWGSHARKGDGHMDSRKEAFFNSHK